MEFEIALTGMLTLMLVFIATFESAFGQLSDVALRSLAESKNKNACFLRHLLEHHQLFWITVISGLQLAAIVIALLFTSIGLRLGLSLGNALLAAFGASIFLGAFFGQFLPRLF